MRGLRSWIPQSSATRGTGSATLVFVSLPRAQIADDSPKRRIARWVVDRAAAPRWMREPNHYSAATSWSASGAAAASLAIGLYALVVSGLIWEADMAATVGWAVFSLLGVIVLFWPFLLSWLSYQPLSRIAIMRNRWVAAAFGAGWHAGAHSAVIASLDGHVSWAMLILPITVGSLWGSWLRASANR